MDIQHSKILSDREGTGEESAQILGLPDAMGGVVSPPLVSLILINWNYAEYVGATIESIKGQDYPWFEAIIVDNGSTDASRDVMAANVAGDSRFRTIHLEDNLGQLGAFLDVFRELTGEFVTVVDADDVLLPNYLSSHIQVHLALPFSVALTSSSVIEVTAAGRVLTGSYEAVSRQVEPDSRGLRSADAAARLSTISETDYHRLSDATRTVIGHGTWIWGPGTANMFRRSVLSLIHYKHNDRKYFRAADNFLCPFAHILGGTAIIDKPLSVYRIHERNYYAERESIRGVSKGRPSMRKKENRQALETIDAFFSRAEFFKDVLPDKQFWRALDHLSKPLQRRGEIVYLKAGGAAPFSDHLARLLDTFGEEVVLVELAKRIRRDDLRALMRSAGWRRPLWRRLWRRVSRLLEQATN